MFTLTESIRGMVTPQLLGSLAARTGLPEPKLRTGVSTALTTIMSGLGDRARDPRAMDDVVALIDQTPDVDDPIRVLEEDSHVRRSGSRLLGLLSHDSPGVIDRYSRSLGVGAGLASSLLAMVAGLVVGGLRKFSRSRGGIDASMLSSALIHEESSLRSILSATVPTSVREREIIRDRRAVERSSGAKWLWLLALIPIALIALWIFNRPAHRTDEAYRPSPIVREGERIKEKADQATTSGLTPPPPAPAPTSEEPMPPERLTQHEQAIPVAPAEPTTPTDEESPAEKATPTEEHPSVALDFPAGSVEQKLLDEASSRTLSGKGDWLTLDSATFDTGSAKLAPEADEQIGHVAQILEEHPHVKVEIAGYTSGTGTAAGNEKLSQQRADAVKQALVAKGIDADRIEVKGHGMKKPAENSTGANDVNRRVAVRIVTK